MKNTMVLGPEDYYKGYGSVSEIKQWAKEERGTKVTCFRDFKKEISLWNKLAKQLQIHNPELTAEYKTLDSNSDNHLLSFVNRIFLQVRDGVIKIEDIGKIEEWDDGSRGSAKTMRMHLLDLRGEILDASTEHMNKYYYM